MENLSQAPPGASPASRAAIFPQSFSDRKRSSAVEVYFGDLALRHLAAFFETKGLPAIKAEDQQEQWYEDWLTYQTDHQLYACLLTPHTFSTRGFKFDLLRYTRFLEVFAYFSPAHGYSLQVTFLGLFSILMGGNSTLKQEAVAALGAGGLLAFGVSEKNHGADLLGNEFTVRPTSDGRFLASGTKFYIGNANTASIISILARKVPAGSQDLPIGRRAPLVLFALRPGNRTGIGSPRKIRTLGVRAAFVGEFDVEEHEMSEGDLIAEGRQAWDAVFGTVTLGKFFLGFGSIGICERALEEAIAHLSGRKLYGKPAIDMPHIRAKMAQVYARLTAMKLYAYRALDYVYTAHAGDRRYLLFAAVQKAKVSTEGVRVMALLSECMGAKGFESDTYFEMALRDVQLIPGLEGSMHINLGLAAQFTPRYFTNPDPGLTEPKSLFAGDEPSGENPYLMEASAGSINTIAFPEFLNAYDRLMTIANVGLFVEQAKSFQCFIQDVDPKCVSRSESSETQAIGQCLAAIAFAQLVAENAVRLRVPAPMVAVIFDTLVCDFSMAALSLASCPGSDTMRSAPWPQLVSVPKTSDAEWAFVSRHMTATGDGHWPAE